jgi:sulfatase maturation enzyme AslB (radical SAM superfamily)
MKASFFDIRKSIVANPQIVLAKPSLNTFPVRYMQKFTPQKVGGKVVLHSHLPPLNSIAYKRFVDEHFLQQNNKPSHAQIGITNICKQNCDYCYNKGRIGTPMDTSTIIDIGKKLIDMGVFWLGFTKGEPLMNPYLVRITKNLGDRCSALCFQCCFSFSVSHF